MMEAHVSTVPTPDPESGWTFLTNHGLVLLCVAREADCRLADIARRVGISIRAVQKILAELEGAGYIARSRVGRRNVYRVDESRSIRARGETRRSVGDLLKLVG